MPAESIHLSALDDTLVALPLRLRATMAAPATWPVTKLGTMFVDLPYYEGITGTLLRHTLGFPPRPSPWGEVLHQRAPIALGVRLGELGVTMQRQRTHQQQGDALLALALGYICHAAVDTALHPLVNRLAAARARLLGDHPLRQHREVEKFHSAIFHEERHGCDYLGRPELYDFIKFDADPLWQPGPLADAVQTAMRECLGEAPGPSALGQWGRGYKRFIALLAGPLGRRAIPVAQRERERPALYDAVGFPVRYAAAVQRSIRWVTKLHDYLSGGLFDLGTRAALAFAIPEQSLDPEPEVSCFQTPAAA